MRRVITWRTRTAMSARRADAAVHEVVAVEADDVDVVERNRRDEPPHLGFRVEVQRTSARQEAQAADERADLPADGKAHEHVAAQMAPDLGEQPRRVADVVEEPDGRDDVELLGRGPVDEALANEAAALRDTERARARAPALHHALGHRQ